MMTSIPTIEDVREDYALGLEAQGGYSLVEARALFDAWLKERERQVAEDAWYVGWNDGQQDAHYFNRDETPNPYTKEDN